MELCLANGNFTEITMSEIFEISGGDFRGLCNGIFVIGTGAIGAVIAGPAAPVGAIVGGIVGEIIFEIFW